MTVTIDKQKIAYTQTKTTFHDHHYFPTLSLLEVWYIITYKSGFGLGA